MKIATKCVGIYIALLFVGIALASTIYVPGDYAKIQCVNNASATSTSESLRDGITDMEVQLKVDKSSQIPIMGKGIWIWKIWEVENGDLSKIIGRLKSTGVKWVVIKCGDSDSYWLAGEGYKLYDWAEEYGGFSSVITQFHNAGIKVFGWHYVYSYDKWGVPNVSEADVSNKILDISGIDGLIINAEAEYEGEGKGSIAEQYMKDIRSKHPTSFIAYSSFARVTGHEWFPWLEFGRYCDANMPQCYWAARPLDPGEEVRRMKEDFDYWHSVWKQGGYDDSVKPIIPVGQGGNIGIGRDIYNGEIKKFCDKIQENRYQGVSLYRYDIMDETAWDEYASCYEELPDLIVEDIWTEPESFSLGDSVKICYKIKNVGERDALSAYGLQIYAYFDGGKVYEEGIEGLGAGASASLCWEYIWPSDTDSHIVKIVADPNNYIEESNDINNERSESFGASPIPTPTPTPSPTPTPLIIIEDADTIWNVSTISSSDLIDKISNVIPRILSEYANTVYQSDLIFSADLFNVTSNITSRILSEYANTIYYDDLTGIPKNLANFTNKLPHVIVIEYANSNYYEKLTYPKALINDTTPPIITNISVTNITENSGIIKWNTEEVADSLVKYGKVPGFYTESKRESLFVRNHTVKLTGLLPGTSYYFVVNSTDRSGNSAESLEYKFTTSGMPTYTNGDINGDGKTDLKDAIYLAKHVVGFPGYEQIHADGDINCDGKTDLKDAIYLAKHVVGLPRYEQIYPCE